MTACSKEQIISIRRTVVANAGAMTWSGRIGLSRRRLQNTPSSA